jgi:hypothetical protein
MCTHQRRRRRRRRRWRDLRILTCTLDEYVALEFFFIQCYDKRQNFSQQHRPQCTGITQSGFQARKWAKMANESQRV